MGKQLYRKKAPVFCLFFSAALFSACQAGKSAPAYELGAIRRGALERAVSSSGTINPVSTAKVLPQMSGKVEKIFVDYNDPVKKGDILAELNTDMLRLKREQQLASVIKARANYELQLINYRNQEALAAKNLISEYELKTGKTSLDSQSADLAVAEANLKVIETEINQYAFITSPIDGIVLDKKINIGDTVVDSSSNNSSNIFTLAENLSEMQIEAVVGELDIVSIRKGQAVHFTLESLPGRNFSGEVEALRMVPVVSNNVVSYTVIVKVENHDGSLLPGMTCAVDFIVESREDALMVSNAALRYRPTNLAEEKIAEMVFNAGLENLSAGEKQEALEAREAQKSQSQNQAQARNTNAGLTVLVMPGGGRRTGGRQQANQAQDSGGEFVTRNIWYLSETGELEVTQVRTGISNGTFTEIYPAPGLEGRQVILREKI